MRGFHATDFKSPSKDNVDNCFKYNDMTFLCIRYMIRQSVRLTVIPYVWWQLIGLNVHMCLLIQFCYTGACWNCAEVTVLSQTVKVKQYNEPHFSVKLKGTSWWRRKDTQKTLKVKFKYQKIVMCKSGNKCVNAWDTLSHVTCVNSKDTLSQVTNVSIHEIHRPTVKYIYL
jgi:hypothetical protein